MGLDELRERESLHAFDWTDADGVSTAVIVAVSEVSGIEPTNMEPLYDAIDPDALDRLFDGARTPRLQGSVAFEYGGYRVLVEANGRGSVYERADGERTAPARESTPELTGEYR